MGVTLIALSTGTDRSVIDNSAEGIDPAVTGVTA